MLETGDEADALLNMLNQLGDEPSPAAEAAPAPTSAAPAPAPVTVAPAPVVPTTEGWHPDPADPRLLRWFDGIRWTPASRPAEGAAAARFGLAPTAPGTPAPPPARPGGPRYSGPAPAPSWPPATAPALSASGVPLPPPPPVGPYGDVSFGAPSRAVDGHRGPVVALAIALAVLLIGGLGFVATHRGKQYPSAWDPRVSSIASFVETERGAHYKHPVPVVFLSVADFKKKVARQSPPTSKERAELDRAAAALRAVGLLSGRVDLAAAADKLDQESVIGFYDPDAKKVWVRGTDLSPYVQATLAHEMTHALQDQLFDLKKLEAKKDADTPIRSLVEADAMRVEAAYVKQLSDADKSAYDKEDQATQSGADTSGIPDVLTHSLEFPYVFGPAFEEALVASGGMAAVDAAFRQPPTTDAEIIDPRLYIDHTRFANPPSLSAPAGTKKIDDGPFGEAAVAEVLGARIGFSGAWSAVQGWRGDDSYLTSDKSGKVCVVDNTRLDTAAHAAAFKQAAQQWAAAVNGTVESSGLDVGLRACDPGPDAKARPLNGPNAFDVLAARAEILHELLADSADSGQGAVPLDAAMCMVDGMVARLGPEATAALPKLDDTDPRAAEAGRAIGQAAIACRPHSS